MAAGLLLPSLSVAGCSVLCSLYSVGDPATGIPLRPRPDFEDPLGVLNVYDMGAKGDGVTDGMWLHFRNGDRVSH